MYYARTNGSFSLWLLSSYKSFRYAQALGQKIYLSDLERKWVQNNPDKSCLKIWYFQPPLSEDRGIIYLSRVMHAPSIIGPQASAVGQILGDGKRPNEKEWDSLASQVAAATSFYLWPLLIIASKCPLCKALLSWAPDFSKVMSTSPSFLIGSYFQ